MALVTLAEAKTYLRVDTTDDDAMITSLISAAGFLAKDVGRLTDDQWTAVQADPDPEDPADLVSLRAIMKVAVLFALAYLYEHREEADHHDLTITMRSLLFSVREGVV